MMVSANSWLMGLWSARSLDRASSRAWRHVWIDDGTMNPADRRAAVRALPGLRWVEPAETDALLGKLCLEQPLLARAARLSPYLRRMVLLTLVPRGDRFVSVDSDVLFFAPPHDLLRWAQSPAAEAWFMHDPITFYFPREPSLSTCVGFPVTPHVNVGLVLFPRGWLNLDATNRLLEAYLDHPARTAHIEQALIAASLTLLGAKPLSAEYELSFEPTRRRHCAARHYVSQCRARDYFYTEGIGELCRFLLK